MKRDTNDNLRKEVIKLKRRLVLREDIIDLLMSIINKQGGHI